MVDPAVGYLESDRAVPRAHAALVSLCTTADPFCIGLTKNKVKFTGLTQNSQVDPEV
jgi:hypothetical protein